MATVNEIELSDVPEQTVDGTSKPLIDRRHIDLIGDLPVNLHVELGQLVISVEQLYGLKVGEVVKLDSQVNQPVKLMFDKQQVAAGVLVAVDDHYGIEITALAEIQG